MNRNDPKTRPVPSYRKIPTETLIRRGKDYDICPICEEAKKKTSKLCQICRIYYRDPIEQPTDLTIRYIPLTQGQHAIVDAIDYDWLMQWAWRVRWSRSTRSFYAIRRTTIDGKDRLIWMHREILGLDPDDPLYGDHVESGKTLDNRKSNLRPATPEQSSHNQRKRSNNTSGFKGVTFRPEFTSKKWEASIGAKGRRVHLGYYATPEEAHEVYCRTALRFRGEFTRTE